MEIIVTYTTTDNKKLGLLFDKFISHTFNDNVGYVALKDSSIPKSLFCSQHTLKSVVIPNVVTSIGNWAFYDCPSLTSVVISNGVKSIGNYVFDGCKSLSSVVIPNSVGIIGDFAFEGCSKLTNIEIPNSVGSIGLAAFRGCIGLKNIEIPDGVTRIGYKAFYACNNLPCRKIDRNERPILAYKGFRATMMCRDFKYEIGKSYHKKKAKVGEYGFHACLNPLDVLTYYSNECGNRFALVELSGKIDFRVLDYVYDDTVVAATNIKVVKELSFDDLIREFNRLNNI